MATPWAPESIATAGCIEPSIWADGQVLYGAPIARIDQCCPESKTVFDRQPAQALLRNSNLFHGLRNESTRFRMAFFKDWRRLSPSHNGAAKIFRFPIGPSVNRFPNPSVRDTAEASNAGADRPSHPRSASIVSADIGTTTDV